VFRSNTDGDAEIAAEISIKTPHLAGFSTGRHHLFLLRYKFLQDAILASFRAFNSFGKLLKQGNQGAFK
jgi:hypothetical protein